MRQNKQSILPHCPFSEVGADRFTRRKEDNQIFSNIFHSDEHKLHNHLLLDIKIWLVMLCGVIKAIWFR